MMDIFEERTIGDEIVEEAGSEGHRPEKVGGRHLADVARLVVHGA